MKFIVALAMLLLGSASFASASSSADVSGAASGAGLVIHSMEMGVGKFHRYDNHVHPYGKDNAWAPYILPDGAGTDKLIIRKNANGSYSIFFNTLEEMLGAVVQISNTTGQKVSVLNVHGHGLPGAMWFPPTAEALNGYGCSDWQTAASGSDQDNYNQYYSAVSVSEIQQIRDISDNPNVHMSCTTGVKEWQDAIGKNPGFKSVIADNAQLHFLSCVVGLGSQGDAFTQGIADLILPHGGTGRVETSMAFGLGDWSMTSGMGFWDYQSDEQINHDNSIYPVDHQDSEIAQKGSVRLADFSGGSLTSSRLDNRSVMALSFENEIRGKRVATTNNPHREKTARAVVPTVIRVPGTNAYVHVETN